MKAAVLTIALTVGAAATGCTPTSNVTLPPPARVINGATITIDGAAYIYNGPAVTALLPYHVYTLNQEPYWYEGPGQVPVPMGFICQTSGC